MYLQWWAVELQSFPFLLLPSPTRWPTSPHLFPQMLPQLHRTPLLGPLLKLLQHGISGRSSTSNRQLRGKLPVKHNFYSSLSQGSLNHDFYTKRFV